MVAIRNKYVIMAGINNTERRYQTLTKGDRIKFFRKQKGLTLEELATCVKLTRQTLSRYENGVIANIPSDQLAAIADVLDASPATLLGWHPTWEPDQYEDFNSAKTISEKLRLLRMWGIPKDLSAYEAELYKNADIIIASPSAGTSEVYSKAEAHLVDIYRSVTEQGQQEMMAHAEYIGDRYRKTPSASTGKVV